MADLKALLELSKKIKEKRPEFIRQETHQIKRIDKKWRKPKGIHSKMRHKVKGKRKMPSVGFRGPSKVRGLQSGLRPMLVNNINQLKGVNAEEYGIIIGSPVGMKNKVNIIKKANDIGIKILNINGEEYLKKFEELVAKKKKAKEQEKKAKEKKQEKKESKDAAQAKPSTKEGKAKADKKLKKAEKDVRTKSGTNKVGEAKKPSVKTEVDKEKQEKKEKDKILAKKG